MIRYMTMVTMMKVVTDSMDIGGKLMGDMTKTLMVTEMTNTSTIDGLTREVI